MYIYKHYIIGKKKEKIETIRIAGGQRLYNIEKYMMKYGNIKYGKNINSENNDVSKNKKRLKICYVRVRTTKNI